MQLLERIKALDPIQSAALLARIRGQTPRSDDTIPRIEPMDEAKYEPFDLTDIQQAYWVGRQKAFSLGNVSAHGYMEVDCRDLDLPKLERVFNRLIRRHDMLRAVVNLDGRQQILREVPDYHFRVYELQDMAEATCAEQLAQVREEMSHQVLDAATWPLFDIRASRVNHKLTRLHMSLDVLIFDAHSFDLLSEEMRRLYRDEADRLTPITLSYADYVAGLKALQNTSVYRRSQNYWREKLRDLPPAPDFPLARHPNTIEKPQFVRRSGRLEAHLWKQLRARAQKLGVTPSAVLLALYGYVLSRWTSSKRFTLNLTIFNRLPFHHEVDNLVGDFTSVILLALDFSQPVSFADLVKRVQQQFWEDMDHRFVSGVWVLRELMEIRRDAGTQLMPVVFTSALKQTVTDDAPATMSWLGEVTYTITQTPQVWLDHQITEDSGALVYIWDAVDMLFSADFLDDMFEVYGGLVRRMAESEAVWQATDLDVLPPTQRVLLDEVNRTQAPVPAGLLHELVLKQCRQNAERIAVLSDSVTITFGELYQQSNCLAQHLWRVGISTGELVAVLLPKGYRQVVAVLGILEAGAAYVPIEPSYSNDRIVNLLTLAGITKVVTDANVLAKRQLPAGLEVVNLDTLSMLEHRPASLPAVQRPTDVAYVIYTSGSTGTPKGVVIDHRGALNTCVDINQRFQVGPEDRVLALSALNFDLSVYDIFGVLAVGGALVMPNPERLQEPAHWAALMEAHGVTLWNTVPALMDIYVTYLRDVAERRDERLRLVMMSGDWIPLSLPDAIRAWCPQANPISLGGATEASIWSIGYPIGPVDPAWRSIPYGKPLLNQTFHVLDEHLMPCPLWVPGELFIGGIGLAKGYWKEPERTAEAFLTHPHTGKRLYRTGDLGRYLPDGNIEFLGRKDFQVKVNGYRVELGEIEANMLAFPGVQSAVAALNGAPGETKQLVGYYVAAPDDSAEDVEKLRFRLSQPGIRRFEEPHETVRLPANPNLSEEALTTRRSHRAFRKDQPVPLEALTRLLGVLGQGTWQGLPKYRYGSAGSLYPVQAYLYAKPGRVKGLKAGLYYYHPVDHALVLLSPGELFDSGFVPLANVALVDAAAFQIFLVGDLEAIDPFYGDFSHNLCLMEAGMICQLLEEQMAGTGLGLCQTGGFDFKRAAPHFKLTRRHSYLHALAGGLPAAVGTELAEPSALLGQVPFENRLRSYLQNKLPDYMVPPVLMRLNELPLSPNGKVDRKALPVPQPKYSSAAVESGFRAPESELAKLICEVWQEILGIERVGLTDKFFDLGGTSVDMINIHTRLQPKLPKEISLVDMFFVYPNIGALLEYLGGETSKPTAPRSGRSHQIQELAAQRDRRGRAQRGRE